MPRITNKNRNKNKNKQVQVLPCWTCGYNIKHDRVYCKHRSNDKTEDQERSKDQAPGKDKASNKAQIE